MSAALVLGLTIATAPGASAAGEPVDVTGYSVKDVVFGKSGCKMLDVKVARKVASDVEDFTLMADVTRSGYIATSAFFFDGATADRIQVCSSDGLGAFKVGPTEVSAYTVDAEDNFELFDYVDTTSKTFYVRGQAKAYLGAKRSGSKVTLTATAKYYNPTAYGYSKYSPKKAKIQRKTSTGWKTIKTIDLKSGKATYTLKNSKKATYRVTFGQTSKVTAATSASEKK
jgi:hypothetical protein